MTQPPPACQHADFPRPLDPRGFRLPVLLLVLALGLVPFADATYWPIYYFLKDRLPLDEFFSTTRQITGITMIGSLVAVIWLFDPPRRHTLAYLLLALAIGGLSNGLIKHVAGRYRPEFSISMDSPERKRLERFIAANPGTPVRIEQRDQWLLGKPGRPYFRSEFVSFPSGHANTAFILAAFLSILYARGRALWFLWAFGCALARVRYRRHFIEDVLAGGALGWMVALWVFSWHWPARIGHRLEMLLTRFASKDHRTP